MFVNIIIITKLSVTSLFNQNIFYYKKFPLIPFKLVTAFHKSILPDSNVTTVLSKIIKFLKFLRWDNPEVWQTNSNNAVEMNREQLYD